MAIDFLAAVEQTSNLDPVSYQYFNYYLNHRSVILNKDVDTDIVESYMMNTNINYTIKTFESYTDKLKKSY